MVQRGVASASQFGKGATARGNDRRVVGAGHGDDDVLRREAAVVVVDLHRVSQRDGFGIGKIVEIMIRGRERPFLGANQATGGIGQRAQRQPAEQRVVIGETRLDTGCDHLGDRHGMRIGPVHIREFDRAIGHIRRRQTVSAGDFRDRANLRSAGNRSRIIGAGYRDRERLGDDPPWPSSTVAV